VNTPCNRPAKYLYWFIGSLRALMQLAHGSIFLRRAEKFEVGL